MDLLFFYINQIFGNFAFPMPADICGGDATMIPMCKTSVSFALISGLAILLITLFILIKSFKRNFKFIPSLIFAFLLSFFLADYAIKQIQDPAKFGIEWFLLLYYFWCFLLTIIFLLNLYYPKNTKKILVSAAFITIIFTLLFAYKGRGNIEQITILIGGLLADLSLKFLLLSSAIKFIIVLFFVYIIFSLLETIGVWVKTGEAKFKNFLTSLKIYLIYILIIIFPAISIPLGEYFNKQDVKDAKEFIDKVKQEADKFYFENGEYPKFIENMLPTEKSPRILARHEYFTQGIRGTYYFSREDKYCFLFQNPTKEFGYYSITSERGWRFSKSTKSYDDSFISLCDETNKSYDSLITNHLGVDSEDEFVNQLIAELGFNKIEPTTSAASQKLNDKIQDELKNNPEFKDFMERLKKAYGQDQKPQPQNQKAQEPSGMPEANQINPNLKNINIEELINKVRAEMMKNPELKKLIEQKEKEAREKKNNQN